MRACQSSPSTSGRRLPHVVRGLLLGQRALLLDLLEERDGVRPLVYEVEEALVLGHGRRK